MSVVAEFSALLSLETNKASFQQGDAAIKGLASTLESTLGADLLGRLAGSLSGVVDAADKVGDVSQELGLDPATLQAFGYAAELSGSNLDQMIGALGRLNSEVGLAAQGVGAQTKLFTQLGIDVQKGTRPLAELLPEIADGIQKLETPAARAAAVTQIFGRGARALIPVLSGGREGIKGLVSEFEALGGGFDDSMVKAASDYNDQMTRLRVTGQALSSTLLSGVLPGFTSLTKLVTGASAGTKGLLEGTNALGAGLAITSALAVAQGVSFLFANNAAGKLKVGLGVAGLALAFDDLRAFAQGADSVIGRVAEKFGVLNKLIEATKNQAAGLAEIQNKGYGAALVDALGEFRAKEARAAKLQREIKDLNARAKELPLGSPAQIATDSALKTATEQLLQIDAVTPVAAAQGRDAPLEAQVKGRLTASGVAAQAAAPSFVDAITVQNNMTVNGGDPKEVEAAVTRGTAKALEKRDAERRRALATRVRP